MRKKLTLMFVTLFAIAAFAATTWKVAEDTPVAAGTTLIDDDDITVKTVFATTLKADAQSFADQEFTNYIQVRVKADPTVAVPEGTDNGGSTSLVVTAKKDLTATFYYRRQSTAQTENKGTYASNDGKDLKVYDQANVSVLEAELAIAKETADGKYGYATKKVALTAGKTYTVSAKGTTVQFFGVTYDGGGFAKAGDLSELIKEYIEANPDEEAYVFNLPAGGEYTLSAPIEVGKSISIIGDAENPATIDASANSGAFIKLGGSTTFEKKSDDTESTYYRYEDVVIKNVTIKNLKQSLAQSLQKSMIKSFVVDNCVINMEANKVVFDFNTNPAYAETWTVKNSTLWSNSGNNKYFIQTSAKCPDIDSDHKCVITLENNTFYQIAKGAQFNNGNQFKGKSYVELNLNNNIFVYSGNAGGNSLKGLCFGQAQENMIKTYEKNTFFADADESANWGKMGAVALTTDPKFKDAANGDFTIDEHSDQAKYQAGDPRWLVPYVGIVDLGATTAAIDVTVPANLGAMDGTDGPTDLALFLNSYLESSPNPAYIKLTLVPGGEYCISKPLETISAIQILGDESNPATIDAAALAGVFVKISDVKFTGTPNANGFYTNIYNVELKNFEIEGLSGSLFSANGQAYLIPNFTVENVLVQTTGGTVIDMDGSVVENLTVTKSTMNGAALAYKATTDAVSAGVTAQTINASYNTFYQVIGLQIGAMLTAPQMSNRSMAPTSNLSLDFNHNVVISDNFAFNGQAPSSMLVQYNSFVKADGTDNSAILTYVPGVGGTIEGDLVFAAPDEVANGNLGLGACPQKTAKIGDPRWLDAAMKISTADLDDDKDLAKAINQGVENGITKFQLEENARYTAKQTIVADKALVITGKNVTIDVAHSDPFILLSKTPAVGFMPKASAAAPALNRAAVEYTDYYAIDALSLSGLKINGLKNSIIYDNNTKYCVVDLTIDDCVLGLETEAVKNEALISFQAGGVKDFTIKNSTVYGNNAVAKYFIRYNNSARLDRYGFDKNTEFQTMTYQNNTFYGLLMSDGQWANYSGIAGQNYSKFVVEKNIWYNCGKDIIRRLSGGRFGGNAPRTFDKNTYFNEGADISDAEGSYDNSDTALTTDPGFKKPAEGDFTLSAYSAQCNEQTGDPRWFAEGGHYNPVTGIETVKTAEETSLENAVIYNLNGQRVEKAQKGINIVNGKKVIIK